MLLSEKKNVDCLIEKVETFEIGLEAVSGGGWVLILGALGVIITLIAKLFGGNGGSGGSSGGGSISSGNKPLLGNYKYVSIFPWNKVSHLADTEEYKQILSELNKKYPDAKYWNKEGEETLEILHSELNRRLEEINLTIQKIFDILYPLLSENKINELLNNTRFSDEIKDKLDKIKFWNVAINSKLLDKVLRKPFRHDAGWVPVSDLRVEVFSQNLTTSEGLNLKYNTLKEVFESGDYFSGLDMRGSSFQEDIKKLDSLAKSFIRLQKGFTNFKNGANKFKNNNTDTPKVFRIGIAWILALIKSASSIIALTKQVQRHLVPEKAVKPFEKFIKE